MKYPLLIHVQCNKYLYDKPELIDGRAIIKWDINLLSILHDIKKKGTKKNDTLPWFWDPWFTIRSPHPHAVPIKLTCYSPGEITYKAGSFRWSVYMHRYWEGTYRKTLMCQRGGQPFKIQWIHPRKNIGHPYSPSLKRFYWMSYTAICMSSSTSTCRITTPSNNTTIIRYLKNAYNLIKNYKVPHKVGILWGQTLFLHSR